MLGVSHGALQFMTYEEMKNKYNQYRNVPIDTKMVSRQYQINGHFNTFVVLVSSCNCHDGIFANLYIFDTGNE